MHLNKTVTDVYRTAKKHIRVISYTMTKSKLRVQTNSILKLLSIKCVILGYLVPELFINISNYMLCKITGILLARRHAINP